MLKFTHLAFVAVCAVASFMFAQALVAATGRVPIVYEKDIKAMLI